MLVVILREHSANKISVRTTQMTVTCFVHASSEQLRNHSVRMLSTSPLHSSPMTTSHRPQQRLYKQSHDGGIKLSCRSNSDDGVPRGDRDTSDDAGGGGIGPPGLGGARRKERRYWNGEGLLGTV